jgi:hypothetical protein
MFRPYVIRNVQILLHRKCSDPTSQEMFRSYFTGNVQILLHRKCSDPTSQEMFRSYVAGNVIYLHYNEGPVGKDCENHMEHMSSKCGQN